MDKKKIKISVVSDVVCPWCYIGKRRLEKAMNQLSPHYEFDLEYLPFELNPGMPKEGRVQKEYLTAKFGGDARYEQLTRHVTEIAAVEGLHFDYDIQHISPNTHNAHRLVWLAGQNHKQGEVQESLMKAYFEGGVDLTRKENLVTIGISAGLEESNVRSLLDTDEGKAEVRYAEQLNQRRGIRGVPFFIINDKFGISGAQPAEVFVQAFTEIGTEEQDTT